MYLCGRVSLSFPLLFQNLIICHFCFFLYFEMLVILNKIMEMCVVLCGKNWYLFYLNIVFLSMNVVIITSFKNDFLIEFKIFSHGNSFYRDNVLLWGESESGLLNLSCTGQQSGGFGDRSYSILCSPFTSHEWLWACCSPSVVTPRISPPKPLGGCWGAYRR